MMNHIHTNPDSWLNDEIFDFDLNSPKPCVDDGNTHDGTDASYRSPVNYDEKLSISDARQSKPTELTPEEQVSLLRESTLLTLRMKEKAKENNNHKQVLPAVVPHSPALNTNQQHKNCSSISWKDNILFKDYVLFARDKAGMYDCDTLSNVTAPPGFDDPGDIMQGEVVMCPDNVLVHHPEKGNDSRSLSQSMEIKSTSDLKTDMKIHTISKNKSPQIKTRRKSALPVYQKGLPTSTTRTGEKIKATGAEISNRSTAIKGSISFMKSTKITGSKPPPFKAKMAPGVTQKHLRLFPKKKTPVDETKRLKEKTIESKTSSKVKKSSTGLKGKISEKENRPSTPMVPTLQKSIYGRRQLMSGQKEYKNVTPKSKVHVDDKFNSESLNAFENVGKSLSTAPPLSPLLLDFDD